MSESTQEAIIKAAEEVFVSKGYEAARMQEIADAAKINKAMLHYYYRSKEMLFHEVTTRTFGMVFPKFAKALKQEGTVIEKIESIVKAYIETIVEHPHVPFFMITELSHKRGDFVAAMQKRVADFPNIKGFMEQMEAEMQAGKIRTVPPIHLILNVMSLCVFPFIAQPILCTVAGIPEPRYEALMQERVAVVTDFIKNALRP